MWFTEPPYVPDDGAHQSGRAWERAATISTVGRYQSRAGGRGWRRGEFSGVRGGRHYGRDGVSTIPVVAVSLEDLFRSGFGGLFLAVEGVFSSGAMWRMSGLEMIKSSLWGVLMLYRVVPGGVWSRRGNLNSGGGVVVFGNVYCAGQQLIWRKLVLCCHHRAMECCCRQTRL